MPSIFQYTAASFAFLKEKVEWNVEVDPESDTCNICFRQYGTEGDPIPEHPAKLPCGHIFGSDCLHRWLTEVNPSGSSPTRCPYCRTELINNTEREDESDEDEEAVPVVPVIPVLPQAHQTRNIALSRAAAQHLTDLERWFREGLNAQDRVPLNYPLYTDEVMMRRRDRRNDTVYQTAYRFESSYVLCLASWIDPLGFDMLDNWPSVMTLLGYFSNPWPWPPRTTITVNREALVHDLRGTFYIYGGHPGNFRDSRWSNYVLRDLTDYCYEHRGETMGMYALERALLNEVLGVVNAEELRVDLPWRVPGLANYWMFSIRDALCRQQATRPPLHLWSPSALEQANLL